MDKTDKILVAVALVFFLVYGFFFGLSVGRDLVKDGKRVYAITKVRTVHKNGEFYKSDTTRNYILPSEVDTILNK